MLRRSAKLVQATGPQRAVSSQLDALSGFVTTRQREMRRFVIHFVKQIGLSVDPLNGELKALEGLNRG